MSVIRMADKKSDCTLWSVRDCLQAMIDDIDSGEINPESIAIHYYERTEHDRLKPCFYISNLGFPEHIALLHIAIDDTAARWRGDK